MIKRLLCSYPSRLILSYQAKSFPSSDFISFASPSSLGIRRPIGYSRVFSMADDRHSPGTPPSGSRHHTNRLSAEQSPYLLQHAHNPVDWYPWGEEAFTEARKRDVPIFLSIGYSTCHWCHVMEVESFEDEEVARLLNDCFISIKVDREERPDVDKCFEKLIFHPKLARHVLLDKLNLH